ncbi:MAG: hypothetical protein VB957_08050 [Pseudomonadales bacterium]
MEQTTGQDASFLYNETPNCPVHIGGLMIDDPSAVNGGKQGFKDILKFVEERLHLVKTIQLWCDQTGQKRISNCK